MILIFSEKRSKRLQYILNLFFEDLFKWEFKITNDKEAFISHSGHKLAYHHKKIDDAPLICAKDLLFEAHISHQEINFVEFNGIQCPYAVYNDVSIMPFDVFAAAFFLVSRYEEYLPHKKDLHKRYLASESIAYQHGFLQKPVIDIWAQWLKKLLLNRYPELINHQQTFKFTPTYDIDIAWSFKNKGLTRTLGGFFRDLVHFNFKEIQKRYRVLFYNEKDPFDTYELQKKYAEDYDLKPVYFFLFGKLGPFDKNTSSLNKNFQTLIKELNDLFQIGIHPSYQSSENSDILKQEIIKLQNTVHSEIIRSRQHFLKLSLPNTYRNLLNQGIQNDYTMGYAEAVGFRAGICTPFYFYDLDLEIETKLLVHPFAVMDGTLRDYMKTDIETAKNIITDLIEEVKSVNGVFISLWHNETLCNTGKWSGWNEVYEHLLKQACS